MATTLHRKLSTAFLAIFAAFAVLTLALNLVATRAFLDEVNQKVALTLASRIATDRPLFVANRLDEAAVKSFFTTAMTINPLAEMYLLDAAGQIVASSVPAHDIRRRLVRLQPLRELLAGRPPPVRGDDPRDVARQKVFSVTALPVSGSGLVSAEAPARGYLYIVLGGEQFDSVVRMLLGSQILRWGAWSVAAGVLCAVFAGGVIFRSLTRPLRDLTDMVGRFEAEGYRRAGGAPQRLRRWPDEIDRLSARFDVMAQQLADYVDRLKRVDAQRRELVANVSHDLRTPLSAVQGYLDTLLIKGSTLSDTERRAFVELALSQGQRVDRMVSELLELSRLESGELTMCKEHTSVCDLVQDVVQKFQHVAAEQRVTLRAILEPDLPLVRIDVRLIERLLDNLLDNALRHTPERAEIVVSCAATEGGTAIRVVDAGDGIHADDLPYIFERFYRGRRASGALGGAGLGLAISRRIAEAHHGRLIATNNAGRGATFTLTLPTAALDD